MTADLMQSEDPMSRSGARWCDSHRRWECSKHARRSDDGLCHASAIAGTAACRLHSGRTVAAAKAIGEANLLAWSTRDTENEAPLDPGQVVMNELRLAVHRANLFGELVRLQLGEDPIGGLVGTTRTAGRDGQAVESGEQVRALMRLEAEQRDRVVRFAKAAHDMGIAERHIELEQGRAEMVIGAFLEVLRVLALEPADRDVAVQTFLDGLGREELVVGEVSP